MGSPTLLWFRQDLRLADHPALVAALERGGPVIPIYIEDFASEKPWAPGSASRWWLHHSLAALEKDLHRRGSRLIIRRGASGEVLQALARETGAEAVFWSRRYEPAVIARDAKIKTALLKSGFIADSFNSALLFEPWTLKTQSGTPYQVFTPFWKACLAAPEPAAPLKAPTTLPSPEKWPASETLRDLALLPTLGWADGFEKEWTPGESGAHQALDQFLDAALFSYAQERDCPSKHGTSRLSPHLHFGEISPRQVWQAVSRRSAQGCARGSFQGGDVYLREIGWREFAYHLLFHFPQTTKTPLRLAFLKFPWVKDQKSEKAWQKGLTGYPIVDAGMRELWATGWMHNRVRMIAASFLVKDLLISWQEGAAWFWDTLVDADLASNTLGWQWTAGCGADAAPYFRVFNPTLQGEKFDPKGDYIRRWVPEVGTADYPKPMVDHREARERALIALAKTKGH